MGPALVFLSTPAAAHGERVLAANTVIGTGDPFYNVYQDRMVAQSFSLSTSSSLINVTLRIRNVGTNANALVVSIYANDPARNLPSTVVLASQSTVSPVGLLTNYNIPFSPVLSLFAGQVYWLVASNGASQPTAGYEWHYSNADTYPGGAGAIYDATTSTWSSVFTDMWFIASGRDLNANVMPAMTASRTAARPQDLVDFTIYFNNTGTENAQFVWINESLPSGFSYVSDTADSTTPSSSTPFPDYVFQEVSNGVHSFRITAVVDIGLTPGTLLTNSIGLAYANATGVVQSGFVAQASVLVGVETKQLYLGQSTTLPRPMTTEEPTRTTPSTATLDQGQNADFALVPPLALAFEGTNVTAFLWANTRSRSLRSMTLNLYLMDANGTEAVSEPFSLTMGVATGYQALTFPLPAFDHVFPAGHRILFRLNNDMSSNDDLILAFNATSSPSRIDIETTTYVTVTDVTLLDGVGPATLWTPEDILAVRANISDPLGADQILGAWINITDPMGSVSAIYATSPAATDPSAVPGWKVFNATYPGNLTIGAYRILVSGIEDNGVPDLAEAQATVRGPGFTFEKVASVNRAKAGDHYAYFLWFNNTGTGPGSVWINDTLPAQVDFESYTSNVPANFTGAYNWSWSSLEPGTYYLEIDVAVNGSASQVAYFTNTATLAVADEKGHMWDSLTAHADVIINGPAVALASSSSPASILHANESVTYTFNLTNTGDAAATIWLNNTMPTGFAYVSDNASAYGGSSSVVGDEILIVLTNMPTETLWTIDLTLTAPVSPAPGSSLTDVVTLNYSSLNGVLMPPLAAAVTLISVSPLLANASVDLLPTVAGAGQVVPASVIFTNDGNEVAQSVRVTVNLDNELSFTNGSSTVIRYNTRVVFPIAAVPPGGWRIWMNFTVLPDAPDGHVATVHGSISYRNGVDDLLPTVSMPSDSLIVAAPAMTLSVTPEATTVEAGTVVVCRVDVDNIGTESAGGVWLNLTLPNGLEYFLDTANATRSIVGSNLTWHWATRAPGSSGFNLFLRAIANLVDGTAANLTFRLEYEDLNQNRKAEVTTTVRLDLVAPQIFLTLVSDTSNVRPGSEFTYSLSIRNNGSTTARWVNVSDNLDSRLEFVRSTANVPESWTPDLSWNLTYLNPGHEEFINLTVRVADGVSAHASILNAFEAIFSNSLGLTPLAYAQSRAVTVTVAVDALPLVWIVLGGVVAAPILAFVVARRQRVAIEEVFLVYHDGVLISHLSRSLVQEKDEDVLSGMLTAVQEFVREAFRYGEHRELHQMDFGDYRILIERGRLAYLAVVYSGRDGGAVRKKIRGVLDRIEATYSGVLEKWDGDMEKVVGVRDLIREYLLKSGRTSKGLVPT
ncbi:MAG TPA: hypothetical protein VIB49_02740 [Thermoplasmata archaeon]|jgi:uncharacterized repeat protein (TIGR01451 family)